MAPRTITTTGTVGKRITARRWVHSIEANAAGAVMVRLERGYVFKDTESATKQFVGLVAALNGTSVLSVIRADVLYAEARILSNGGRHILEVRRVTSTSFEGVGSFMSRDAAIQVARDEYYCEVRK